MATRVSNMQLTPGTQVLGVFFVSSNQSMDIPADTVVQINPIFNLQQSIATSDQSFFFEQGA
jgi:hypothetical protein